MKRQDTFKFRLCDEERAMLAAIAKHLRRTQSDSIRILISEAVRQLEIEDPSAQKKQGVVADAVTG